jgi:fluoride exporter
MLNALLVALGGAIGAVGRYLMGAWFQSLFGDPHFPWGTLLVNVFGAFLIGIAFGLSKDGPHSSQAWSFLVLGALGAYTTYSTYALETLEQFADGRLGLGLLNAFGQLVAALIVAYIGVVLVRGLQGMGGSI